MSTSLLQWLITLDQRQGSDLYLTFGAPPMLRGDDGMAPLEETPLDDAAIAAIIADLTTAAQRAAFERDSELNMALDLGRAGRFRINILRQRQHPALVIRRIATRIPTFADLHLPPLLGELCREKRGLILVVGGTGSGKSTSMAAMLDDRNSADSGHIITIEDPIEYLHDHKRCLITQREVGMDTRDYPTALKNALRQKPDLILIGEIRDSDTMDLALSVAETGHLCLATLHANNANQAIERVLSFFETPSHPQILRALSQNLRAILSQRLVRTQSGGRRAALEILLNQGLIRELIRKGEVKDMKAVMADNRAHGMQTFDQALLDLWREGVIDEDTALAEADNAADLRVALQQTRLGGGGGLTGVDTSGLSF